MSQRNRFFNVATNRFLISQKMRFINVAKKQDIYIKCYNKKR